jgi:hypothetical protein
MDFTIKKYSALIESLIKAGYCFQTFKQFLQNPQTKAVVFRHDVDLLPENSYRTALIENSFGVCGSYYFRIVKESFKPEIIQKIEALGHEIGYHYENMDTCRGKVEDAYRDFCTHLATFRSIVPINSVCMHGSPLSKYDNRDIWKKYDYKKLGLIGEPYFDLDFSKILYLTDTGRCWNGSKTNVRDKAQNTGQTFMSGLYNFSHTTEIIRSIKEEKLPSQIMINVHPQRWSNNVVLWSKELIMQSLKNQVKRLLVLSRS